MKEERVHILVVDDNEADRRLMTEFFKRSKIKNELHALPDGVEAIAFLRKEGKYSRTPRPDVIFLDLNMPKMNGREVLEQIKKDDALKSIPVVVLTSSEDETDIARSYELLANCYVTKPIGFDQFEEVAACVENFWFTLAQLPRAAR